MENNILRKYKTERNTKQQKYSKNIFSINRCELERDKNKFNLKQRN